MHTCRSFFNVFQSAYYPKKLSFKWKGAFQITLHESFSQSYVIAPNYLLIRLFHSNALTVNGSFGFLSHHMMMVFTTQTLHSPWSSEKHRINDFQATQKDCISKTVRERDRSIIMRCPSIQSIKGKNSILTVFLKALKAEIWWILASKSLMK